MEQPKCDEDRWLETGRLAELGLLAASLVHELRQPLFAIKAMLQLTLAEGPDERLAARLSGMLQQAEQMEKILGSYSGLVQKPGSWSEPHDPNGPIRSAIATLAHRAALLNVTIRDELETHPPILMGNPVALQQVIVNLLQNAIDAATQSPEPIVTIRSRNQGEGICIWVNDNGPGIPPEDWENVFRPFFTTKPPGRGTGLGLTISRELVRRMGGSLSLQPEPKGTTVEVFLPARNPAPNQLGELP